MHAWDCIHTNKHLKWTYSYCTWNGMNGTGHFAHLNIAIRIFLFLLLPKNCLHFFHTHKSTVSSTWRSRTHQMLCWRGKKKFGISVSILLHDRERESMHQIHLLINEMIGKLFQLFFIDRIFDQIYLMEILFFALYLCVMAGKREAQVKEIKKNHTNGRA